MNWDIINCISIIENNQWIKPNVHVCIHRIIFSVLKTSKDIIRKLQKQKSHYVNGKMTPVETIPGMGKENGGGEEFNYDIFDIL
jgi:hypothetical protein